jgi:hypothetical protein
MTRRTPSGSLSAVDDPYALLGVDPSATADEIDHAYRHQAMRLHPDHADPTDTAAVAAATKAFVALGEAHRLLVDPARRAAWDAEHAPPRRSTPPGAGSHRHRRTEVDELVAGFEVAIGRAPTWSNVLPTRVGRTLAGLWLEVRNHDEIPAALLRHPELFDVRACAADVSRHHLELLATNPSIRRINLSNGPLGDDGVAVLSRCRNLEQLVLDGTGVTDACCESIAHLSLLQELSLQETGVGDVGVAALARCASLHALDLRGTHVTGHGLRALDHLDLWRMSIPLRVGWHDRRAVRAAHPHILLV